VLSKKKKSVNIDNCTKSQKQKGARKTRVRTIAAERSQKKKTEKKKEKKKELSIFCEERFYERVGAQDRVLARLPLVPFRLRAAPLVVVVFVAGATTTVDSAADAACPAVADERVTRLERLSDDP
jgi:hypothetical protein